MPTSTLLVITEQTSSGRTGELDLGARSDGKWPVVMIPTGLHWAANVVKFDYTLESIVRVFSCLARMDGEITPSTLVLTNLSFRLQNYTRCLWRDKTWWIP